MKQLTAVTAFAFVLSAGLSVGIFAGIQSTDAPRSSDSCSLNKKKDNSKTVSFQAKDGKECDKEDCDCNKKKNRNMSKTVNKKECDHKKNGNTSKTSSKKECDHKKKQQTRSKKECDEKKKKTASSGSGS